MRRRFVDYSLIVDGFQSYRDIIAYDRTLLKLDTYINASLIREPDLGIPALPRRHWIAAQAPIPSTIYDFYSILFHFPCSIADPTPLQTVNMIVQLTALVEGGRRKAHPYFPEVVGETVRYQQEGTGEAVAVTLRSESGGNGQIARTLEITLGTETRNILHSEFLGWGDQSVIPPPLTYSLLVLTTGESIVGYRMILRISWSTSHLSTPSMTPSAVHRFSSIAPLASGVQGLTSRSPPSSPSPTSTPNLLLRSSLSLRLRQDSRRIRWINSASRGSLSD